MLSIDEAKCNGCRVCTWVCPHGVLEMSGGAAAVAHGGRCIECGACMLNCSEGAVSVNKGVGCLTIIIKEDILGIKDKSSCCG